MKQIYILLVAMCAMCFTGCSKDNDDKVSDEEGVITMVINKGGRINFWVDSFKEGETITIDWGDGLIEEVVTLANYDDESFLGYDFEAKHSYAKYKPHTIIIKGNIKALWIDTDELITTLDVSKCKTLTKLSCGCGNLTTLDISECPALTELHCNGSNLTTLDVSKCLALTELYCYNNNNLTTLNASGCKTLTELYCINNDKLTTLNVSGCKALTELGCQYNNNLTTLDVSKCPALTKLYCPNNDLSAPALNQIFNDLPQSNVWFDEDGKRQSFIMILDNPGSTTCNRSIAENKGWEVWYEYQLVITHR